LSQPTDSAFVSNSQRRQPPAGDDSASAAPGLRYHPYYCEENAWWLCAEPTLGAGPHRVLFVLSRGGLCPLAAQRAAPPGQLCWWDYHVVVLDGSDRLWDLDTRLGLPVPALTWLAGTFPLLERLPADMQPLFRVVPAADYRAHFASDRSHMRSPTGDWLHPPPPWPPIGAGMRLPDYRSTAPGGPGERLDWRALRAALGA
jgi:protein N-terminal glutamine amidohydrolase